MASNVQSLTALRDTDTYCITFGSKPIRTPIKAGEALLFNFVSVVTEHFTVVQSGLNQYMLATVDFTKEPKEEPDRK